MTMALTRPEAQDVEAFGEALGRRWRVYQSQDDEPRPVLLTPTEATILVGDLLAFLDDTGGMSACLNDPEDLVLRAYVMQRIWSFVESGIIDALAVNAMSNLIMEEPFFVGGANAGELHFIRTSGYGQVLTADRRHVADPSIQSHPVYWVSASTR